MKDVIVIGGPNGAGKTTAAAWLLPRTLGIPEFVNADEIAHGLSPFNPGGMAFAAGRLMIERIHTLVRAGESFAFETTCAGRGHARLLRLCRTADYRLTLLFLWLPTPQAAMARVARRVEEGGHFVPDAIVVRRYRVGLYNMRQLYMPLVDIAVIYDNSDGAAVLVAERGTSGRFIIHDRARWKRIEEATR
ncbi:MAG: Zeta toxin family protein [Alphaproteobacteria bacterium]|nr:Zeta toxin family protein [Alphaproteobacteria bacterium]